MHTLDMIKSQPVFGPVDLKRAFAQYARLNAVLPVRSALLPVVSEVIRNNLLLEVPCSYLFMQSSGLHVGLNLH